VDERRTLDEGGAALAIGGAGAALEVPGLVAGALVEVVLGAAGARLRRVGGARVSLGGREVAARSEVDLPAEALLSIDGKDFVLKREGAAGDAGEADSERPSVMARDVLKQVFSALGVPDGDQPALVAYDENERLVKRIDLTGEEVTIGRTTENRLVLYHASVSKSHARVSRDATGWMVHDLESKNGIEVNGEPVKGKARLRSGDRIRVGQFTVRFVDPKAASADLSASMPDLKRLDKAKPGEKVEIGDKAGALGVHDTQTQMKPSGAMPAVAKGDAAKAAPTPASSSDAERNAAVAKLAASDADEPSGAGAMVYILVGAGVLILLTAVGVIVLASRG